MNSTEKKVLRKSFKYFRIPLYFTCHTSRFVREAISFSIFNFKIAQWLESCCLFQKDRSTKKINLLATIKEQNFPIIYFINRTFLLKFYKLNYVIFWNVKNCQSDPISFCMCIWRIQMNSTITAHRLKLWPTLIAL